MNKTYVAERKIEYWTSRQIEDAFISIGHDIDVFPLSLQEERDLPADFIFASDSLVKVFGIQYKTLYHDDFGRDFWKITNDQHGVLLQFDWIYYGLSEVKEMHERGIALHLCRFKKPSHFQVKNYQKGKYTELNKVLVNNYRRWGGFYKGLIKCDLGKRITSEKKYYDFIERLQTEDTPAVLRNLRVDLFFTDLTNKRTVKFSG